MPSGQTLYITKAMVLIIFVLNRTKILQYALQSVVYAFKPLVNSGTHIDLANM